MPAAQAVGMAGPMIGQDKVDAIVEEIAGLLGADWAVIVDASGAVVAAGGEPPEVAWLVAFIAGSTGVEHCAEDLTVWAGPDTVTHLVVARAHPGLRSVERLVVGQLFELMGQHRAAIDGVSRPVA